jgi:hypothetical protein
MLDVTSQKNLSDSLEIFKIEKNSLIGWLKIFSKSDKYIL